MFLKQQHELVLKLKYQVYRKLISSLFWLNEVNSTIILIFDYVIISTNITVLNSTNI